MLSAASGVCDCTSEWTAAHKAPDPPAAQWCFLPTAQLKMLTVVQPYVVEGAGGLSLSFSGDVREPVYHG